MFTYIPCKRPKVVVLCDTRTLNDENRDHENGTPLPGVQSVLNNWSWGLTVWGRYRWQREVARIALFSFGQEVTKTDRKRARTELAKLLADLRPERIVVLQSRSKSAKKSYTDDYAEGKHSGTVCWDFFDPPGPIPPTKESPGFAGCLWDTPYGTVMPIFNPQNVDYVYGAVTVKWLSWIRDLVPAMVPPPATSASEPGEKQQAILQTLLQIARNGQPITFDLETFSTEDLITCIGLSDGMYSVSVPWEPFRPHGQNYTEPGLWAAWEGDMVREVFATASVVCGHNIERFDLPYLARKGIRVTGRAFDTYIAHGVAMNQFRHGLQQSVSYEFPVPPWKALHQAAARKSGLDPSIDARAWIQDPRELRRYNLSDVYNNSLLVHPFAERIGFTL